MKCQLLYRTQLTVRDSTFKSTKLWSKVIVRTLFSATRNQNQNVFKFDSEHILREIKGSNLQSRLTLKHLL